MQQVSQNESNLDTTLSTYYNEGAQEDMKFESRCKICTYTPAKCPKWFLGSSWRIWTWFVLSLIATPVQEVLIKLLHKKRTNQHLFAPARSENHIGWILWTIWYCIGAMAGATGVLELINLRYHQQAYSKASAKEEIKFETRCEFCTYAPVKCPKRVFWSKQRVWTWFVLLFPPFFLSRCNSKN